MDLSDLIEFLSPSEITRHGARLFWADVTSTAPLLVRPLGDEGEVAVKSSSVPLEHLRLCKDFEESRVLCAWMGTQVVLLSLKRSEPTWKQPTMLNGWENYGRGFAPAAYRLEEGGVRLSGLIRFGQVDMPAFKLSKGPTLTRSLQAMTYTNSTTTSCRILVNTLGEVTPSMGADPTSWVTLDGLFIPY